MLFTKISVKSCKIKQIALALTTENTPPVVWCTVWYTPAYPAQKFKDKGFLFVCFLLHGVN